MERQTHDADFKKSKVSLNLAPVMKSPAGPSCRAV